MVQYSILNEAYLGKATTSLNETVSLLILSRIIVGIKILCPIVKSQENTIQVLCWYIQWTSMYKSIVCY